MNNLLSKLRNNDFEARRSAVIEIAKLGDTDKKTLRILYLELSELKKIDDKALNYFIRKAESNLDRIEAMLGTDAHESDQKQEKAQDLEKSLFSDDQEVRLNALQAIHEIGKGSRSVLELLERFAQTAKESEAVRAVELIEELSMPETPPPVITDLTEATTVSEALDEISGNERVESVTEPVRQSRNSWGRLVFSLMLLMFLITLMSLKLMTPEQKREMLSRIKPVADSIMPSIDGPDCYKISEQIANNNWKELEDLLGVEFSNQLRKRYISFSAKDIRFERLISDLSCMSVFAVGDTGEGLFYIFWDKTGKGWTVTDSGWCKRAETGLFQ